MVVHRDDEQETCDGIALHASYIMTATWLHRNGAWKLALVHAYVVARDPPEVAVPARMLADYVGRYALGDGVFFVITLKGEGLLGGTAGRPPGPLRTEAPDLLFIPGQPRIKLLFRRGADHRVIDFVLRREAEDLIYKKIG